MAVKILITLEGTEQINSALDAMSAKGEDFMKTFQSLGAGGQSPLSDVAVQLQTASSTAGEGLNKATDAAHGFAEALRIILPGLRLAGVEVGNFAGFARLASVGVEALAVAITGAVIVALANLEETASRTQSTLSGLFGSQALGGQAFSAIQESATALQTTVGGLAPIFQAATTALAAFYSNAAGVQIRCAARALIFRPD